MKMKIIKFLENIFNNMLMLLLGYMLACAGFAVWDTKHAVYPSLAFDLAVWLYVIAFASASAIIQATIPE